MAVNFTKNQDQITGAWREVADSKEVQNWALFGYEGNTNNIRLMSTGSNGLEGLVQEFNSSLIQYAFCRVIIKEFGINKLILINWQGDSSPLSRKGLCASHVGDVVDYFKGCSQTITIRNEDEATKEYLTDQIMKSSSSRISLPKQQVANVDSGNIQPNIPNRPSRPEIESEISAHRKSFWQKQEEEEKERLLEEKKRADEKQAQFEKERRQREESEAKKLAETIRERDRMIEATRRADRRESSGSSQPNSILSTTNLNEDKDDERVGRRSELIRLERNQETLSLIGKGQIKNKRAIFEQASQQQQQQQQPSWNTMARRSSGAMIAQRLKSYDSNDGGSDSSTVEKLTNGFSKQVDLNGDTNSTIEKKVESIKMTTDGADLSISSQKDEKADNFNTSADSIKSTQPIVKEKEANVTNFEPVVESSENNNHTVTTKNSKKDAEPGKVTDDEIFSEKYGIKARALFDYEAVDNSEISFDPDDLIGFIEKVDKGWWYGSVVTGRFKGQSGLFPSNYVEEL